MSFFKKIFSNRSYETSNRGFYELTVKEVTSLTSIAAKITFNIPEELKEDFSFVPGQYINVAIKVNGKDERRSYSICSGQDEGISIGVKAVDGGLVSNYLVKELKEGDSIEVSKPLGTFTLSENDKNVVAIAAGSGITPIMALAKAQPSEGTFRLFFGNRRESDIMFKDELNKLTHIEKRFFLSGEEKEGYEFGRIDKYQLSSIIKNDLSLLKSDAFMICGPKEMIEASKEVLTMFGVSNDKIHFELFTPLTEEDAEEEDENHFKGESKVAITIDHETEVITVKDDQEILDTGLNEGMDLPYSCKGGVCSTCKAKLTKGEVHIKLNYVLTDKEVADGYILTCQSQPRSEEIELTYDI